jgi:hypothetical protein
MKTQRLPRPGLLPSRRRTGLVQEVVSADATDRPNFFALPETWREPRVVRPGGIAIRTIVACQRISSRAEGVPKTYRTSKTGFWRFCRRWRSANPRGFRRDRRECMHSRTKRRRHLSRAQLITVARASLARIMSGLSAVLAPGRLNIDAATIALRHFGSVDQTHSSHKAAPYL